MWEPSFSVKHFKMWVERDSALRSTVVQIQALDREGKEQEAIELYVTDSGKIKITFPPRLLGEE